MPKLRTPLSSVALHKARGRVLDAIRDLGQTPGEEAARAIKLWHREVQTWQDADTLKDAFEEGRLTFRTMCHTGGRRFDYGTQDTGRQRVLGLVNNDDYFVTVNDEAVRPGGSGAWEKGKQFPKAEQRSVRLDAGGAGIIRRVTPANFVRDPGTGRSRKNDLGLHDLSACLLNPDGYALKKYTDQNLVVLMPLPLPIDVHLFYVLRDVGKLHPAARAFHAAFEVIRTQFTRPRLASSLDMGTSYLVAKSPRHGGDSVKYVKGQGKSVTSKESPDACRLHAREDYRGTLERDAQKLEAEVKKATEITVAYRRCGTRNRFPVFGLSVPGTKTYLEVNLIMPVEDDDFADYAPTGRVIDGKTFDYAAPTGT